MSTTSASSPDDGFEVVVADDGTLTVPADELARHGVRPGTHLRLVPEERPVRSMQGALRGTIPAEAVDDLVRGLDEAKAERAAQYTGQMRARGSLLTPTP